MLASGAGVGSIDPGGTSDTRGPGGGLDQSATSNTPKPLEAPVSLISQAIEQVADDSGWAHLGFVGNHLTKVQPDCDPRLHGCRKLGEMLRIHADQFETTERGSAGSRSKAMYARVVAQKESREGAR